MIDRPKCPKCKSGNVYFRTDKSMSCRRCGYDSRDELDKALDLERGEGFQGEHGYIIKTDAEE